VTGKVVFTSALLNRFPLNLDIPKSRLKNSEKSISVLHTILKVSSRGASSSGRNIRLIA